MISNDFFKTTKILDGGMGQLLLARGVVPRGTLWSASALVDPAYHGLLLDAHLDYIAAGADVIVTSTFTTRRMRLIENQVGDQFDALNTKAGEIARQAKAQHPHVMVAGSLPPQHLTYEVDCRPRHVIQTDFYDQACVLDPFVDFFYFDAISSITEFECGIAAIESFKKPFLLGVHISEKDHLPSGEDLLELSDIAQHPHALGVILACVSPETITTNLGKLATLNIPFGFKMNAFKTTAPNQGYTHCYKASPSVNPNQFLGQRTELSPQKMVDFVRHFKDGGATILGGCCETTPDHIRAIKEMMR
jgi:homocysteine S-methyltransferase